MAINLDAYSKIMGVPFVKCSICGMEFLSGRKHLITYLRRRNGGKITSKDITRTIMCNNFAKQLGKDAQ